MVKIYKNINDICRLIGELTVSQVEPLFDSVIRTYYKLDELGIKEVDGEIVFIDNMEVSHE